MMCYGRPKGWSFIRFVFAACDHHHSTTPDRPSIILGPLLFKFTLTYAFEELNISQPKNKSFFRFWFACPMNPFLPSSVKNFAIKSSSMLKVETSDRG